MKESDMTYRDNKPHPNHPLLHGAQEAAYPGRRNLTLRGVSMAQVQRDTRNGKDVHNKRGLRTTSSPQPNLQSIGLQRAWRQ